MMLLYAVLAYSAVGEEQMIGGVHQVGVIHGFLTSRRIGVSRLPVPLLEKNPTLAAFDLGFLPFFFFFFCFV